MSILGTIMSSILGGGARPAPPPAGMSSAPESASESGRAQPHASAPTVAPTPPYAKPEPTPATAQPAAPAETPSTAAAPRQVDVAAVLDKRAEETGQDLNWRTSIVDLMKLLKLDSGLAARKRLAKELSYAGDSKDSAAMNVWLHKQVMAKLVQGGGKLPSDIEH
jgi:pyruvate/2-oxoglutarate dehydrogenase complex dihydrolipoamide acyltransferase (E2) component